MLFLSCIYEYFNNKNVKKEKKSLETKIQELIEANSKSMLDFQVKQTELISEAKSKTVEEISEAQVKQTELLSEAQVKQTGLLSKQFKEIIDKLNRLQEEKTNSNYNIYISSSSDSSRDSSAKNSKKNKRKRN